MWRCGWAQLWLFLPSSPIVAYDGEAMPGYAMADFTQSTVPGCCALHLWFATNDRLLCKGFCRDRRLISSASTYPASEVSSRPVGQDGDTRALVLINSSASCAVFNNNSRLSERRLRSGHLVVTLSQTSLARPALSLRPNEFYAATDTALASNGFPRCSTAQAILASLLAKATTTTLRWVLLHAPHPPAKRRVALGHIGQSRTRSMDRCLRRPPPLPRLLIPSSFGLPPAVN